MLEIDENSLKFMPRNKGLTLLMLKSGTDNQERESLQ